MHEHHVHCAHVASLAHCAQCDVVYCTACKREWGQRRWQWTYPVVYGTTVSGYASTTVTADTSHTHG